MTTPAARVGQRLAGSTLYTTTFPCHECARHIIATGIHRVVYVEPYPKSRVGQLHSDAVRISDDATGAATDDRIAEGTALTAAAVVKKIIQDEADVEASSPVAPAVDAQT